MNARLASIKLLSEVIIHKKSLAEVFHQYLDKIEKPADKGLCHQITYGTLRNHPSLVLNINQFLKKPISKKNILLEITLSSAAYQILFLKIPDYAVINETIKLTDKLNISWAKGLINAVLRKVSKLETNNIKTDKYLNQPAWLFKKIKLTYPNNYKDICKTNRTPANTMLRVHNYDRDDYLELLNKKDIKATLHPDCKEAIILTTNISIPSLPLFSEGNITVQDANAQIAANLMGIKDNMSILDACAAPGGKTAHIFTKANNLEITAVDEVKTRVERMQQNFTRLNIIAKTYTSKLENLESWYQGGEFDRILLDAPCSATGIVRKHPDINYLRKQTDIEQLVKTQEKLLDVCWGLLKTNGILVYATCSILGE